MLCSGHVVEVEQDHVHHHPEVEVDHPDAHAVEVAVAVAAVVLKYNITSIKHSKPLIEINCEVLRMAA